VAWDRNVSEHNGQEKRGESVSGEGRKVFFFEKKRSKKLLSVLASASLGRLSPEV
jgi:hypothetical protein